MSEISLNPATIQAVTSGGYFTPEMVRLILKLIERGDELQQLLSESGLSSTSAFGENVQVPNVPYIEGTATYDLIPANFRTFSAGTGSAASENRLFKVATGTTALSYGAIQSFRSLNAKVGQSLMSRFSGYFTTGVADSQQGIGLISIGDELSFGYSGTDFGIWHRYGGISEVRTLTVTGSAGGSENLTLTLNGTGYTIPLTAGSAAHNAYEIEAWLNANQTVWTADQLGSTVIISALGDGAKSGTYSFSSATATGTIAQTRSGVTKTSDFIAQEDWNGASLTSALDPTKGNIYQIIYQNMGFGDALFYVEDAATAKFVNVHTIRSANSTTTTVIGNPSLRCGCYAYSLGSTTNLSVYADSFSAFIQGSVNKTRNPRARSNTQTLSTTNETNILTIRNRKTYNGYPNQVEIQPLSVYLANETNKNVILRVRAVQDVGIEQNFSNIGTNLVSDVDTTAINFTGGRLLAAITVAPADNGFIDLTKLEIAQPPGLKILITAQRTGGASGDVTATLNWYEDL